MRDLRDPVFVRERERLKTALGNFRDRHGFGRAIAAPQIGFSQRLICGHLDGPRTWINPRIVSRSEETCTLWDDCMSFPELMVKLRRHRSISIEYLNEAGEPCREDDLPPDVAELLQHEIDHLDGILAVDRALDRDSIVHRRTFAADYEHFARQVDLAPSPTGNVSDENSPHIAR